MRIQALPRGFGPAVREVIHAMREMPATMKQLAVMKLFQWFAMFCYWQYIVLSSINIQRLFGCFG